MNEKVNLNIDRKLTFALKMNNNNKHKLIKTGTNPDLAFENIEKMRGKIKNRYNLLIDLVININDKQKP